MSAGSTLGKRRASWSNVATVMEVASAGRPSAGQNKVMAHIVVAHTVTAYIVMAFDRPPICGAEHSYGPDSYGLYSHGL